MNRVGDMPRFYFDIQKGTELIPDDNGFEIDSLEAAEHEAMQTAITLGRDWLPFAREVRVRVRDEHGRYRLNLSVALTVERVG
jgi:hypothetical protein